MSPQTNRMWSQKVWFSQLSCECWQFQFNCQHFHVNVAKNGIIKAVVKLPMPNSELNIHKSKPVRAMLGFAMQDSGINDITFRLNFTTGKLNSPNSFSNGMNTGKGNNAGSFNNDRFRIQHGFSGIAMAKIYLTNQTQHFNFHGAKILYLLNLKDD